MWFKRTRKISTLLDIAIEQWKNSKVDGYSRIDLFEYQLRLNRFNIIISNYSGICSLFDDMYNKKIITSKEHQALSTYIYEHKPSTYVKNYPYFFAKGFYQLRLDYLLNLRKEFN